MNIFSLQHRQPDARILILFALACITVALLWLAFPQRSLTLMLGGLLCAGIGVAALWNQQKSRRAMHDQERAHAEEQQRRFDCMLDLIDDAWWEWNVDQDRHKFSARWWSMLGYAVDEYPADSGIWHRLAHPDDVEEIKRAQIEAIEQNTTSVSNSVQYLPD
jgi:PAS domain-containing protein